MDYDLHVTLHVPQPPTSAFDRGTWDGNYIPVPTVARSATAALQAE